MKVLVSTIGPMRPGLDELLDPKCTVVVLQECQNGVIGPDSLLPELAQACQHSVIPNGAAIADAARGAGVRIVHTTAHRREDGWGANTNARLFAALADSPVRLTPGTSAVAPVAEMFEPEDVVVPRLHGLSPFQGTELDSLLRNEGVRTIVACGVSVNIAIANLTFDAVNAGYEVVIPVDAVAGVPADYAKSVLDHTLSLVATITDTADVVATWA